MSYISTPNRNIPTDEYLQQKLGKLNLENEIQNERLCNRNDSNIPPHERYDSHMEAGGSAWDCSTPQTRNLDTIVTNLTPEEVRWFYKCDGEKRWLEFSGYDSLHIELKFRELFVQSSSYSKYSAFSDTPKLSGNRNFSGTSSYFGASSIKFPSKQPGKQYSQKTDQYEESLQMQNKIVVRGGLYDINFENWKCSSIYWPGEECQICRGTWFYENTWQPLEQEYSQILELKHLSMFEGRKLSEFIDNETKGIVMHTETFPDFIVEWISPSQVYLYSENTPSKVVRTVTTRLGFRKSTGYRLFRGYKNEANLNDRPDVEINHLVFVIHGIGQKMDTGRIIRNTSSFRDCVSWLKQKYFSNFPNHRAEFFPVEWRSNLQLDGDLVDAITPNTLQSLRQMLNASAMDIMYYTSPLYGGEVQRGLREELNRLYSMFSARNPYFMNKRGKISIIAHSLGCVILYDIIMGLKPGSLVQNNQQGLLFQVQNFFCLGSPLSVFLALRWKDSQIPGKIEVIFPQRLCHRLYNVFHPTDPLAYRIEPFLVKSYSRIAPLVVQSYNANFHTPYSEMPIEIIVPEQQNMQDTNQSGQSVSATKEECSPGGTPKEKSWNIWGLRNKGPRKSSEGQPERIQEGLEHRLDYILRESNLGVSYLSALTSHTAYWTNYDVAYFILTQIFPELENNDPSLYTDKNYLHSNTYNQNYSQDSQYNYENKNYSQYDSSNFKNLERGNTFASVVNPGQQAVHSTLTFQDNLNQPPPSSNFCQPSVPPSKNNFNQPLPTSHGNSYNPSPQSLQGGTYQQSPRFQQSLFQQVQDYQYLPNVAPQNFPLQQQGQSPSQQFPQQQGQPPPQQFSQQQGQPPPQQFSQQQGQPPPQQFSQQQGQPPPQQFSQQQRQPPPQQFSQQQGQPPPQQQYHNQAFHQQSNEPHQNSLQTQPHGYQTPFNYSQSPQQYQSQPQQPSSNFTQTLQPQTSSHNYSQQSTQNQQFSVQEQVSFQKYQPPPPPIQAQNPQVPHMNSGSGKNIQTKTGFFDKITEDKKAQGVSSPTKSTKSFFPSFNLSSLTSPVKNLSNSLSNISNQMTNIGSGKENVGGGNNSTNVQNRSPASLMGSVIQAKNVTPNYAHSSRNQSPQVQFTQGQFGHYQQVNPGPNQMLSQNLQQNIRSSSPYDMQNPTGGIRSGSPVSLQNRYSPMQYGPIETPVGAIKPKTIRLQPKVPKYEQKLQFSHDMTNTSNKTRCLSPLGQSRVICSGSRSFANANYGSLLGGRSLSSGNLRNSTLVSGTYPGSRSSYNYLNQSSYSSLSGLDRRTMSRPNLSTTESSYITSGLGISSLTCNSPFGAIRTYLNREYSGPNSGEIWRQLEKQSASNNLNNKAKNKIISSHNLFSTIC